MNNNKQLDDSVSFAKGIGIILMVLGHTFFSPYGHDVIYMFHMPLFFFISGYCFKESYLEDFRSYARKRIGKIYVPFVKWGLICLFCFLWTVKTEKANCRVTHCFAIKCIAVFQGDSYCQYLLWSKRILCRVMYDGRLPL